MTDALPTPGHVVAGKYRVERVLGEGGHGVVLAAHHIGLGERVAIKMLRPQLCQDQETIARFLREARAAVRIRGEHVTRVLDVGSTEDGLPFMVMEHLEGADLASIVERHGPMVTKTAVDFILQTCEALAEAHALGIVHRDIKPSNLFLTTRTDGTPCVKVLDFGISKVTNAAPLAAPELDLTQTQSVLGSPQYMAPEQMRSSKNVDARTDIWALGTTLYELLTGRAPFEAKTMPEIFAMILQDPAPSVRLVRSDVPEALDRIVLRCLEKKVEHRFRDVVELALALTPFASEVSAIAAYRLGRIEQRTTQRSSTPSSSDVVSAITGPTIRTEPPAKSPTSKLAAAIAGGIAIAVASVALVVVARSGVLRSSKTASSTSESAPPVSEPLPPSVTAREDDTPLPPPPPTAIQEPAQTQTPAGIAAGTAGLRAPKRPHGSPSASAPPSAAPTSTPSPHPTGIASSRYD